MIIELKTKTRLISNRRNRMLLTLVSPVCCVSMDVRTHGEKHYSLKFLLLRDHNDINVTSVPRMSELTVKNTFSLTCLIITRS